MAVLGPEAMKKHFDKMFKWRMAASFDPIETLSSEQLQYRKQFEGSCARLDAKFGAEWDRVFGIKK